jgi:hypothetical protein
MLLPSEHIPGGGMSSSQGVTPSSPTHPTASCMCVKESNAKRNVSEIVIIVIKELENIQNLHQQDIPQDGSGAR